MPVDLFDTSFVDGYQYHWFNRIISVIAELIVLSAFAYHVYLTVQWKSKGDKAVRKSASVLSASVTIRKWQKVSHMFTMITLLSFVIMGANYVFNTWSVYGERASCHAVEVFSVISYHWCKFSLYVVLVARIQVAFADSIYKSFTKKILYFLYAMLFIFGVVCLYGDSTEVGGEILYTSPNTFYCILLPLPTWGLAFFLLSDIIISVSCCVVFIYPLKKLLKLTNASSQRSYIELIRKYSILTTTAVISTLVLVLLNAVLRMGFLVLVDNVVNTLCILMMSSWYDAWYTRLCCCCHSTATTLDRVMSSRSLSSQDREHSSKGSKGKTNSKPHLPLKNVGSMSAETQTTSTQNEMVVVTPPMHEHDECAKEVTPIPQPKQMEKIQSKEESVSDQEVP